MCLALSGWIVGIWFGGITGEYLKHTFLYSPLLPILLVLKIEEPD